MLMSISRPLINRIARPIEDYLRWTWMRSARVQKGLMMVVSWIGVALALAIICRIVELIAAGSRWNTEFFGLPAGLLVVWILVHAENSGIPLWVQRRKLALAIVLVLGLGFGGELLFVAFAMLLDWLLTPIGMLLGFGIPGLCVYRRYKPQYVRCMPLTRRFGN